MANKTTGQGKASLIFFHFRLYNVFISPPRNKQTVIRFRRIERNQIPNGNLATINKRGPFNDSTYMTIKSIGSVTQYQCH